MATIQVDGREYQVNASHNLLQACLSAGLDLPYFCWHPALGSVGACRQCAVKQYSGEDDRNGRIVMACMTPASDGARISIADAETADFRKSVIEWLMTNHPHDCPVCEEGGECHLQDMTLMSGHTYRRYRFDKRTHRNQDLGPFIKHEMNRCIACYRCVRFYRDYAGGRDLDVHAAHNDVYFGRHEDGVLESEFSGNLVEVCPTGVFTDKTLSVEYARKWDMEGAPSVCVHCGLGCNTIANARYGELRRILNRYNGEVNRYFICDRGRFGYGFVNAASRLRSPLIAQADTAEAATGQDALDRIQAILRDGSAIGIGSPRASLEANFALRELVGAERFHLGVSDPEYRLLATVRDIVQSAPIASLREAEDCDAAIVLGEDVSDTAPRLALTLRQVVRHKSIAIAAAQRVPAWQDAAVRDAGRDNVSPLFLATPLPTRLDDIATERIRSAPDDIARLGFAIAHAIDASAPEVSDVSDDMRERSARIAGELASAARPLIVAGVACGSEAVLRAAAALAAALRKAGREARLVLTVPECNSLGLALISGAPLGAALDALRSGSSRTVIVLENDLYRRAEHARVEAALNGAKHVVAIDHTLNDTVRHAEVVLPAATFAEGDGTLVNNEGRAQRFFQLLADKGDVAESWRWLDRIATKEGDARWRTLDDVMAAMAKALPHLAAVADAAPPRTFRIANVPVRSAPHRYSGRTAMHADRSVREPIPRRNPDAPFTQTMEGYYGRMPGALYPFFWAPGWNSAQALNKFQQEVGGPLAGGDPGVRVIGSSDESSLTPSPSPGGRGESAAVGDSSLTPSSSPGGRGETAPVGDSSLTPAPSPGGRGEAAAVGDSSLTPSSSPGGRGETAPVVDSSLTPDPSPGGRGETVPAIGRLPSSDSAAPLPSPSGRGAGGEGGASPIPSNFTRRQGEWLVLARYPIFGAEELSARAPAMAQRIAAASITLHPGDAARLKISEHDLVELEHDGQHHRLPVTLEPALQPGTAVLAAGLPGIPWMPLPAWMAIRRAETGEHRR